MQVKYVIVSLLAVLGLAVTAYATVTGCPVNENPCRSVGCQVGDGHGGVNRGVCDDACNCVV